jgi:hypothetical protein
MVVMDFFSSVLGAEGKGSTVPPFWVAVGWTKLPFMGDEHRCVIPHLGFAIGESWVCDECLTVWTWRHGPAMYVFHENPDQGGFEIRGPRWVSEEGRVASPED